MVFEDVPDHSVLHSVSSKKEWRKSMPILSFTAGSILISKTSLLNMFMFYWNQLLGPSEEFVGPICHHSWASQGAPPTRLERSPSAFHQSNDMVQTPSRLSGDGLFAFCAEPLLMPPQIHQFLFPFFTVSQLSAQSFFEIVGVYLRKLGSSELFVG